MMGRGRTSMAGPPIACEVVRGLILDAGPNLFPDSIDRSTQGVRFIGELGNSGMGHGPGKGGITGMVGLI